MQQPFEIKEPSKVIGLQLTNASAVFLHQMLGSQPTSVVAGAGQEGLYGVLGQQIVEQNAPQPPQDPQEGPAV